MGTNIRPRSSEGKINLCGPNIKKIRIGMGLSQRDLAALFQNHGFDVGRDFISRTERQRRTITDTELKTISGILGVSMPDLVDPNYEFSGK